MTVPEGRRSGRGHRPSPPPLPDSRTVGTETGGRHDWTPSPGGRTKPCTCCRRRSYSLNRVMAYLWDRPDDVTGLTGHVIGSQNWQVTSRAGTTKIR